MTPALKDLIKEVEKDTYIYKAVFTIFCLYFIK